LPCAPFKVVAGLVPWWLAELFAMGSFLPAIPPKNVLRTAKVPERIPNGIKVIVAEWL
jgi:hypothetical protein